MLRTIRSIGVLFVAMLGAIGLAVGSAFSAALAFGAIGLFVPGTGTPNANIVADYLPNARDRYTQNTPCNDASNCTPLGINYPASFFPVVIIPGWCRSGPDGCDKWNDSVGKGTDTLDAALAPYLDENSTEQVTLFGYSQGGAVISNELQRIAALNLDQSVLDRLHVVTIGGIQNPDGGLWQRLGFLPTIPFFDISFGPAMKTDNGFDTTAIGFEYDPVTYAPRYWGNPLALLNAFAALETVHGYYLVPNGNGPNDTLPYGYTPGAGGTLAPQLDCSANPSNCRFGSSGETTYIIIPATSLPIFDLLMGAVPAPLKPVVQPLVNLLTPVTKLLIDLGYDFSGDPDKPTPLSILPFNPFTFNPIDFSVKFVQAIVQGIHDAINGGPSTMLAPAVPAVAPSTFAVRSVMAQSTGPTVDEKTTPVALDKGTAGTDNLLKGAGVQEATHQAAADKNAADKVAADQAAVDKAAADTATADRAAADKAAADKARDGKDAADKAKDAAHKDAVAQAAADKAKEAAQNAKDAGAAGDGATKTEGTDTGTTDPAGSGSGAGESEKQAA